MSQPPYTPPPGPAGPPGYPGPQPPQPRSSNTVVIVIVVVVASLLSCGIFSALGVYGARRYLERARAAGGATSGPGAAGPDAGGSGAGSAGVSLQASDGLSEITLPSGWRSMPEMGGEGVVRAGNAQTDQYLLVITEPKVDFAPQVDLAKYGEVVTGAMEQKMANPELGVAKAVTVGTRPALQYELSGAVDLLNLGYIVTVVDGAEHYHQILIWTTKSKLASSRAEFQRTIATFRER